MYVFQNPAALALGVSDSEKIGAEMQQKLSDDLYRRMQSGDWKIGKSEFRQYATSAGTLAGAAACTAYGLAVISPICGTVAGEITGFLVDDVWGPISSWFGSDSEEREAERRALQLQHDTTALNVASVYSQMGMARMEAEATLLKLASDLKLTVIQWNITKDHKFNLPAKDKSGKMIHLGGLLEPDQLVRQLYVEGLPKGPTGYSNQPPDWPAKFASGEWTLSTIVQDAQRYIDKLYSAEAKVASKLVAAAAAKKAFATKLEDVKKKKIAEEQQAHTASMIGWTFAGLVGLAGLWWWKRRKKR